MLKSDIINSKRLETGLTCYSLDSEFNSPECFIDTLLSDHSFVHLSTSYLPATLLGAKDTVGKKKIHKAGTYEVERKRKLLKLCPSSDSRSLSSLPSSQFFSHPVFV